MVVTGLFILAASALPATSTNIDELQAQVRSHWTHRCDGPPSANQIVICAEPQRSRSKYRLPKGFEGKDSAAVSRPVIAGDVISHGTAVSASASCGPFAGQRTCKDAEAAQYGYERGRDPITFVSKIIGKIVGGE